MAGTVGAVWGIAGLSLLFCSALFRLFPYARELSNMTLSISHWAALGASLLFMGYMEGYKGFQCRFSPRAAARALYLKDHPTPLRILLAPLFCMGFFHAPRRRRIAAYSLTTMIIILIILIRHFPQPWRGIVDAGVLLGLGWGVITVWYFAFRAFFGNSFSVSPETPEE
jgi:hypothetical protein